MFPACLVILCLWNPWCLRASGSGWADEDATDVLQGNARLEYRLKHDEKSTCHRMFQTLDATWLPWDHDSGLVFSGEAYENVGDMDDRSGSVWDTYGDAHGFVQEACLQLNGLVAGLIYRKRIAGSPGRALCTVSFSGGQGACVCVGWVCGGSLRCDGVGRLPPGRVRNLSWEPSPLTP